MMDSVASHVAVWLSAYLLYVLHCQRHSEGAHLAVAAAMVALSLSLSWRASALESVVAGALVLFLTLACPLWFMHVQEYKTCVALLFDQVCTLPLCIAPTATDACLMHS